MTIDKIINEKGQMGDHFRQQPQMSRYSSVASGIKALIPWIKWVCFRVFTSKPTASGFVFTISDSKCPASYDLLGKVAVFAEEFGFVWYKSRDLNPRSLTN
jgi:hypothetical protein